MKSYRKELWFNIPGRRVIAENRFDIFNKSNHEHPPSYDSMSSV